jgi:hypothetical protein
MGSSDVSPQTLARWASEVASLSKTADEIAAKLDSVRAKLRDALEPGRHLVGKFVVTIAPNRRFDPELVPVDHRADLLEEVISQQKAKDLLPPLIYERCCIETGRNRVRVSLRKDDDQ